MTSDSNIKRLEDKEIESEIGEAMRQMIYVTTSTTGVLKVIAPQDD